MNGKCSALYPAIKWIVKIFSPKFEVVGAQQLPDESVIFVGNHAQMYGPIASELYAPGSHYTWCAGQMMHLKDVPDYAYQDFWAGKPKSIRWFYRLLSYIIAPLSVCVFTNANTIGVYHDSRIVTTFKQTVQRLQEGHNVVIFPESGAAHNHIVCQFQDRFVDVAKLYYKRTGKAVLFVPVYVAPNLKKLYLGKPVRYDPDIPMEQQRQRICGHLMDAITKTACDLPEHRVVPYRNVGKKNYPLNKEPSYEKTGN